MKTLRITSFVFGLLLLAHIANVPPITSAQEAPPVLAFYYAWFDQNTWASGQSADLPAEPYQSADPAAIQRHVAQAQGAGIDAFVQSWYGPQEANNQTETNFRALLDVAQASGFKAAVDVECSGPFFGDANAVQDALATLLATHAQHPAYLRYQGKPVIFFWRQQRFSVEAWHNIRRQVDPAHNTYWIAEGVDIEYQDVFDGHHLYSVAWAASPAEQLAKWGDRVRNYAAQKQSSRLWIATVMPGYDDTRLPRDNAFVMPRRNGDYYREVWRGAVASAPAMIVITSFNEWPEGTHIEPSQAYGNLYLDITRELVTGLRGAAPVIPAAVRVHSQMQENPEGPYIQVEAVTNVRQGPSTNFAIVERMPAGGTASVVGRTEAGDWWQIEVNGTTGWVSADVVEFFGNAAEVPVVDEPAITAAEVEQADPAATAAATTPEPAPDSAEPEPDTPRVNIAGGGVNVRSGPGLNFDLLGRLEEGDSAVVVGRNDLGDWWLIEYEKGENGLAWVADVVVDFVGDPQSVPFARDTEPAETLAPTATPTPEPVIAGSIKVIDPVNLRAEPAEDSERVGGLYLGDVADVLAVSEDGIWWQIEFSDSPAGFAWVSADFVEFTGDINRVPIFGKGTPTPTPAPTATPTTIPPSPTRTLEIPATWAPTATSVYKATSEAILASRTPNPSLTEIPSDQPLVNWSRLPWGIVLLLLVVGLFWYQFRHNRKE